MQLDERLIIAPIRSTKSGMPGPIGPQGPKGDSGEDGLPPAHEWANTALRFKLPDGTWGPSVDLKGDKGDSGGGAGSVSINVEDESGNKSDLELIKYQSTDRFVSYDQAGKSLSVRSLEHSYQLDWSVNVKSELPTGDEYIGAMVYVKTDKINYQYDGVDWNPTTTDKITAEELSNMIVGGKWITVNLSGDKGTVTVDANTSFMGEFDTLEELKASVFSKVNGQTIAVVKSDAGMSDRLYLWKNNDWSSIAIHGNLILADSSGSSIGTFTKIRAGTNVDIAYDEATKQITINSTGSGGSTDLSEYVKGADVKNKYPNTDWVETEWDSVGRTLKIGMDTPKFEKMNTALIAGNNITFSKDPTTELLKISADAHVDLTDYVLGAAVDGTNGIKTDFAKAGQQLTIKYEPEYTDLSKLVEAGAGVSFDKGAGEKLRITATQVPVDLSEYAKKSNIIVPNDYWGNVEVAGDAVNLKIKPTAEQINEMISDQGDITATVENNKVKLNSKDGRKRLYSILSKRTSGKPAMLKAGNLMKHTLDETNRVIQFDCTAREFDSSSVDVVLPLTSVWDSAKNQRVIDFSLATFTNMVDTIKSNVVVGYDETENKITYNVNPSIIPIIKIKKDEQPEELLSGWQIKNAGDSLVLKDDPTQVGKKTAILTIPTPPKPLIGKFDSTEESMSKLELKGSIPNQISFSDGNMTIDLDKGYYVGVVGSTSDLPLPAIANKSYGYVRNPSGYDNMYLYNGTDWVIYYPVGGMLLEDTSTINVIKKIKKTPAVSINSDGELTVSQGELEYLHNGTQDGVHTLEVSGAGVATSFDVSTGALKLDISGGGGGEPTTPLKVGTKKSDGSVSEYEDTREIIFSGDVEGVLVEDNAAGGKKLTIPIGVLIEVESTPTRLAEKYAPSKHKGKFVFNQSSDENKLGWFACNGVEWIFVVSKNMLNVLGELADRLPESSPTLTDPNSTSIHNGWFYFDKGTSNLPQYKKPDGSMTSVSGAIMNVCSGEDKIHQTFFPLEDFTYPMYRTYSASTSSWTNWEMGDVGGVEKHNNAQDAHEEIFLPAIVATMKTNWEEITNQSDSKKVGNIPLMLLSDNTGKSFTTTSTTDGVLHGITIPRTGKYNIKLLFQITGASTAHGSVMIKVIKNNTTEIVSKSGNVATADKNFDAYEVNAMDVGLTKGDSVSVLVSYSGSTTWSLEQKKQARIDAMKNYLVIEHKDTVSGSLIANTYRELIGGISVTRGYEAVVYPGDAHEPAVPFVEVSGAVHNTSIINL